MAILIDDVMKAARAVWRHVDIILRGNREDRGLTESRRVPVRTDALRPHWRAKQCNGRPETLHDPYSAIDDVGTHGDTGQRDAALVGKPLVDQRSHHQRHIARGQFGQRQHQAQCLLLRRFGDPRLESRKFTLAMAGGVNTDGQEPGIGELLQLLFVRVLGHAKPMEPEDGWKRRGSGCGTDHQERNTACAHDVPDSGPLLTILCRDAKPESDPVDAAALGFEDLDVHAIELESLPYRRHTADACQDIATDSLEPFGLDLDVQAITDLVEVHLPAEDERSVGFLDDRLGLDVVLVADLADDLFEEILDGREASGAAVFV